MNPQTLFHDAASNIIYLVLLSTRYDYENKTLREYVQLFTELSKIANGPWGMVKHINTTIISIIYGKSVLYARCFVLFFLQIYDTLPVVRYLPLPFKKAFTTVKLLKRRAVEMINKHKTTRVPGQPRDFVDCYLDEIDKVCVCV